MPLYLGGLMDPDRIIAHMQDNCYHVVELIRKGDWQTFGVVAASEREDLSIRMSDMLNNEGYNTIVIKRKKRGLFWNNSRIKSISEAFYLCAKAGKQ